MKIKINLRQINDSYKTTSTQDRSKTVSISSQSDDKCIIYDYTQKDSVLYLKIEIGKYINESPDSIELWHRETNKSPLTELNDMDQISSAIMPLKHNNRLVYKATVEPTVTEEDEEMLVLYYKLILYPIHIMVDFYQNKIEKITQTVSASCSIYMLKHRIEEKFMIDSNMIKAHQKLFGLSLKNRTHNLELKMEVNKEYDNKTKLSSIIKEFESKQKKSFTPLDLIHLKFLLVLNMRDTLKMGLNFNFNYFKNLSQINFAQNAPIHRECSDGLNMFAYCRNTQCKIYNEMFVRNVGYGCFDIIRETLKTRCPYCRSTSLAEVRNIGMINANWVYNGLLNDKKISCFEGDGTTIINNRLYLLSEVNLSNVFSKLLIKINPHKSKNDLIEKEMKRTKSTCVNDASSLFDSIPLCLDKKYYIQNNGNKSNEENDDGEDDIDNNNDGNDVNESVAIFNRASPFIKNIESESKIENNRQIRTEIDDKGAYCMNGCLFQKGTSSSKASCIFF